jgi:hypothetical protein
VGRLGFSIGKSNGEAVIVKTFRAVKLGHLEVVVALSIKVRLLLGQLLTFHKRSWQVLLDSMR